VQSNEWETEIRAFEARDRVEAPSPGATLFAGGSSIRCWSSLDRDMSPLPVLNRGFGGALLADVVRFAPRIVTPCRPRAVVLYAGENDLEPQHGKSGEDVAGDLAGFHQAVESVLPDCLLYVLSIKPSPARSESWEKARDFNDRAQRFCGSRARLRYVDVWNPSLDERGIPRRDLFLADGLHLSERGYARWTSILRPLLLAEAD
jgi:lysophospholipase L1-like esterase